MLVTVKEILGRAHEENYAVAAPNVNNSVEVEAAIMAAETAMAPLILNVHFENQRSMVAAPREFAYWVSSRAMASIVPIAINQHHGHYVGACRNIQCGVSSVMSDTAREPLEENIAAVRKMAEVAHSCYGYVGVEAELGYKNVGNGLTDPGDVVRFVRESGCDFLAISLCNPGIPRPEGEPPHLHLDLLDEIRTRLDNEIGPVPLVLHGTYGAPDEQISQVCRMGINKMNIAADTFLNQVAMDAILASGGKGNPFHIARDGIAGKLREMIGLYGSEGKAWIPSQNCSCYYDTRTMRYGNSNIGI